MTRLHGFVVRAVLLFCVAGLIACSRGNAPTATVAPPTAPASAAPAARPTGVPTRPARTASPAAASTPPSATSSRSASPPAIAGATPTRANCPPTRSMNNTGISAIGTPPVRSSVGQGHILSGTVRSARDCAPLAGATLIFWLAGPDGKYAAAYEATVRADATGTYRFESPYPGSYEGTSPHIHMFVTADGHSGIETAYQLAPNQTTGTFDIVLPTR
jgi:protocatechuate 3,4-dioxygenase beta subunit